MASRLRAGLVGCGKQGITAHLPAMVNCADVHVIGVVDINPAHSAPISEELGIPSFTSTAQFLDQMHPDFIVVCVPHAAYNEIIEVAASRNVHVLKEKPFAMSMGEAMHFQQVAAAGGIHLSTVLQRRYSPQFQAYKNLLGKIDDAFLVEARYSLEIADPSTGWRALRATAGGGCILDMGYHMIDLLIWYFGLPSTVMAKSSTKAMPAHRYDAEDSAAIMFTYDSPLLYGTLIVSRPMNPRIEYVRTVGSGGQLDIERVGKSEPLSLRLHAPGGRLIDQDIQSPNDGSMYAAQLQHFCQVLRNKAPNETGIDNQLPRIAFIEACYESERTGAPVRPLDMLDWYNSEAR